MKNKIHNVKAVSSKEELVYENWKQGICALEHTGFVLIFCTYPLSIFEENSIEISKKV